MTRRNRAKSSSLFLMELILAILFFSIASAVCVQFFVKSHLLSQRAQELNYAVSECSSVAEIIDTSDGFGEAILAIQNIYPESTLSDNDFDVEASVESHQLAMDLSENLSENQTNDSADEEDGEPTICYELVSITIFVYYDKDFGECAESDAVYLLTCELQEYAHILTGEISVTNVSTTATEDTAETSVDDAENDTIYTLTAEHYVP